MASKKRKQFSIEDKIKIIDKIESGSSNAQLAKECEVAHSTISTIWKNKEIIRKTFEEKSAKVKKIRPTQHQDIEAALLKWFKIQRNFVRKSQ